MSVRGRAHTGFVGEQTACNTETHSFLDGHTGDTARECLRLECADKDRLDGAKQGCVIDAQDDNAAHDVKQRHDRHDFFGHRGDALDAAEEDEGGYDCHNNADIERIDTEGVVERIANRVRLHHIARKAQCKDDGEREETGEEFAERALETGFDVVDGAAGHMAIFADRFIFLRQYGFAVNGGHAEKGRNPHPENRAGAAGSECGCAAGNVAGADLRGDGGSERLKRAHALMVSFFAVETERTKHAL